MEWIPWTRLALMNNSGLGDFLTSFYRLKLWQPVGATCRTGAMAARAPSGPPPPPWPSGATSRPVALRGDAAPPRRATLARACWWPTPASAWHRSGAFQARGAPSCPSSAPWEGTGVARADHPPAGWACRAPRPPRPCEPATGCASHAALAHAPWGAGVWSLRPGRAPRTAAPGRQGARQARPAFGRLGQRPGPVARALPPHSCPVWLAPGPPEQARRLAPRPASAPHAQSPQWSPALSHPRPSEASASQDKEGGMCKFYVRKAGWSDRETVRQSLVMDWQRIRLGTYSGDSECDRGFLLACKEDGRHLWLSSYDGPRSR